MADEIKITELAADTTPALNDVTVNEDLTAGETKKVTWQSIRDLFAEFFVAEGADEGYLPYMVDENTLGNSGWFWDGTHALLGYTTAPNSAALQVNGAGYFNGQLIANGTIIRHYPSTTDTGAFYLEGTTPSASNYKVYYDATDTALNGASNVVLAINGTPALSINNTLSATFASNVSAAGSYTSSAPSGGSADAWKFGSKVSAVVTLITTDYLQVEVGGVAYKLALVS